jgi:hypothetical protein
MALTIDGGITFGGGIGVGPDILPPNYSSLVLNLDAATYSGTGPWIDSVNGLSFTLNNSPTYSAIVGGGSFDFVPASSQWADCSTSLASISTWSVDAWHYYEGTNTGSNPCLITETFVGGAINYTLGWPQAGPPNFQAGFFNGSWQVTPSGYTLTSGAWYQIVGTYDGNTVKLYVNDTLINQQSYTGTPTTSGAGIRLMARWDSSEYWGGKLGIVRIYDEDIGAAGVTANWNANRARFGL